MPGLEISLTNSEGLKRDLDDELNKFVRRVADDIFVAARANTPVKSGRARSNWTESVGKSNFKIENRVPYIERLEAGASRQAPKGIIGPTLTAIKGKYR